MTNQNQCLQVANEFTFIEISKKVTNNGEVLEIESKKSQRKISLDAMQLEALTLLKPEDFSKFFEIHYGSNGSK
ncbi:MAG TPA: dihydrodiol dehydrogenase [Bacillales bacterium]|nr:dihydrodiol dehydrogenase [Bacillales bacterium]